MSDSADRFEAWIDGMSEEEFQDRLESDRNNGGFSDAQEEKALNIREPVEDTEAEQLIREQESRESQPTEVYDTRQLPQKKTFFQVVRDRLVPVRPKQVMQTQPASTQQVTPQQARPITRPTVRQRIASFFSFMRRRRPTPPTGEA